MSIFHVIALFGGLALFLYGIRIMGDGLKHGSSGALKKAMGKVTNSPIVGFLLGLCVTAVIQSSSATIGVLQALSVTGQLTFGSVYPILVGIYLGDCVTTAIVCSIGAKADAKRTGMVHILFNLSEAVLVFAAVNILHSAGALDRIWAAPITSGGIANTHTLFNLACAVLLLPLCGLYEKLSRIVVHDDVRHSQGVEHELQLLDDKFFTSPELALSSSDEAIATMARLACAGADSAMGTLGAYDRAVIETVQENEQSIDMLADAVNNYLVRLSGHMEADDNSVLLNYYLQCFSEFERIGDYAVNLTESAEELHARGAQFSTTARQELAVLQDALHEIMGYAADAFTTRQASVARHIEPVEEVIDDLVETLRARHTRRLLDGKCTVYGGLGFLNSLTNIERIADQCSNLGIYTIALTDPDIARTHHDYIQHLHQGRRFVLQRRIPGRTRKIFWPARRAGRLSSTESPLLIGGAFWRCGGTCGAEPRPYKHIGTLQ